MSATTCRHGSAAVFSGLRLVRLRLGFSKHALIWYVGFVQDRAPTTIASCRESTDGRETG